MIIYRPLILCVPQFSEASLDRDALGLSLHSLYVNPALVITCHLRMNRLTPPTYCCSREWCGKCCDPTLLLVTPSIDNKERVERFAIESPA